jgi:Cohesin domain
MYIKNNYLKFVFVCFFVFLCTYLFPSTTLAATLNLVPSEGSYSVGDTISVRISVDSAGDSVNAISANLKFPSDKLTLTSISKSNSIITVWAQEPSYSNATGTANIEGVVLNGYTGGSGTVASLVFKAKAVGGASVSFDTASVLANDGNGTEMISGKQNATFVISNNVVQKPKEKETTAKPAPVVKVVSAPKKKVITDTHLVISEIVNSSIPNSKKSLMITSPQEVRDNLYTIVIDSSDPIAFFDDGSHIFTTPTLANGEHNIKITAFNDNDDALSGVLKIKTQVLKVPEITYYDQEIFVGSPIVIRGIADPVVDVELTITNKNTSEIDTEHVQTNSEGKFVFVPVSNMVVGEYSIAARAINQAGIISDYMIPLTTVIKEHKFNAIVSKLSNYTTMLVPLVSLFVLFLIIVIYGFYHIKRIHKSLSNKLDNAEDIIQKSFGILEDDVDKEITIFRKLRANRPITEEEQSFLSDFKKDIKAAEKVISAQVKEVKKTNTKKTK